MPDHLTAGPEMDAAVAEACGIALVTTTTHKSHDWQNEGSNYYGTAYTCSRCFECVLTDDLAGDGDGPCEVSVEFRPSTDLNYAFRAAEKVGLFTEQRLSLRHRLQWEVGEYDRDDWYEIGEGSTPAEAICRAILALHPKESA